MNCKAVIAEFNEKHPLAQIIYDDSLENSETRPALQTQQLEPFEYYVNPKNFEGQFAQRVQLNVNSSSAELQNPAYQEDHNVEFIKRGGVYFVPVWINDVLKIDFILDSGASNVTVSPDIVLTLIKTGTIEENDFLPGRKYRLADGTIVESKRFNIRKLRIGNQVLYNVECSISNSIEAPMLLGQNALEQLGSYTFDYDAGVVRFHKKNFSTTNIFKFNDVLAAYERGDFTKVYQLVRLPAEQGNSDAEFLLAQMYYLGLGVPKDYQQALRWYPQRYQQVGIQFIVHRNTGREPANKTPDGLKRQVQSLIKEKYYDVNLQHLAELLDTHEGIQIKRETLRNWAHDIHHVKRAKRRRSQVRKRRERMESAGLLLQMDGSSHRWFGDQKACLIAIIDDATSEIHAEFFESETTQGCLKVMRDYIEQKGLFKALYVDKAGIFGGPKRCNFSQMQRACEELGIEILFANSPQGKGRIERSFDTFQDRLIPELRLRNISDMQSANRYLQEVFIPKFWRNTIAVSAKNAASEFTPVPAHLNLDDICVQKAYRKIRNDHTFSYGNKFYLIESSLRHSIAKQKIEIRQHSGSRFTAYFAGRPLAVSEVIEPTKPSLYDLEIQKKIDAIELAEKLGNVSEAARISGCSRETIYKNRRLLKEKGPSPV